MHRNRGNNFRPTPKITNQAAKNRNLGQDIGGAIFGCTNETYKECTTALVFGLPASNWQWVQHVQTGMPIFLFNYNDKRMHGIFRAIMPGTQNINPQGWTSITHTGFTRYPAQVKVEWFDRCRPILNTDFKRAMEGAFFTDKQFTYQLTKDEARRLCEMFSKTATKRLYEGNASGPVSKAVRQDSQPAAAKLPGLPDAPAAPNPPEAPPSRRPSPSSSTGSSELRKSAHAARYNAADGWVADPPGPHATADSAAHQNPPSSAGASGNGTQTDSSPGPQPSQAPVSAWQKNRGAHVISPSAQQPQPAPQQQHADTPTSDPSQQKLSEQQKADSQKQQLRQQRVKPYRSVASQQPAVPYRPEATEHIPPSSSLPTAEFAPRSSPIAAAAASNAGASDDGAAKAWWDDDEEDQNTGSDPCEQHVTAPSSNNVSAPAADLAGLTPVTTAADSELAKQPSQTEANDGVDPMQQPAVQSGYGASGTDIADEKYREEEQQDQGREEEAGAGGANEADVAVGPSDGHSDRQTEGSAEAEERDEGQGVDMLGTTPPGMSSIQPVAAAISQLTASQQGVIYLLGGGTCKQESMWLDFVDVYDPSIQACTPAAPLPKPCAYGSAVAIGQRLFYVGGGNGENWFKGMFRLSLNDDTWEAMAEMHEGRGSLFTAMQGYLLWAVGGRNKFAFHDSTECYHPAQDVWLAGPQMSRKRFAAAGGVLNNAVYVTGGFDGQSYTNSCEKLDAREGKWSLVGSMLTRRGSHACAVQEGRLYAFGGWAAQHSLRECEVYEARADRWRAVAPMHETRAYFAGVACQGSLYAMGGLSPAPNADPIYKTTLEAYDAKQDSWRTVKQPSNFLLERAFMSACVVSQA